MFPFDCFQIEEPEISEPAPATLSTEEIPMPNQNGPQTVLENHVNKQKQTQNNVNKEQNNSTKLPTHENYYNQFQHLQHSQQNSTTHQQTRIPNYSHASNYASTPVGKTTQSILSVDDAAPYSRVEKPGKMLDIFALTTYSVNLLNEEIKAYFTPNDSKMAEVNCCTY